MDIKKVIKEKGWTQENLAKKMGITQASLYSLLNGNPTLSKLKAIAEAIGISVAELVRDEENNATQNTITCPHCGKQVHINIKIEA